MTSSNKFTFVQSLPPGHPRRAHQQQQANARAHAARVGFQQSIVRSMPKDGDFSSEDDVQPFEPERAPVRGGTSRVSRASALRSHSLVFRTSTQASYRQIQRRSIFCHPSCQSRHGKVGCCREVPYTSNGDLFSSIHLDPSALVPAHLLDTGVTPRCHSGKY
jgi:hypothetical protein